MNSVTSMSHRVVQWLQGCGWLVVVALVVMPGTALATHGSGSPDVDFPSTIPVAFQNDAAENLAANPQTRPIITGVGAIISEGIFVKVNASTSAMTVTLPAAGPDANWYVLNGCSNRFFYSNAITTSFSGTTREFTWTPTIVGGGGRIPGVGGAETRQSHWQCNYTAHHAHGADGADSQGSDPINVYFRVNEANGDLPTRHPFGLPAMPVVTVSTFGIDGDDGANGTPLSYTGSGGAYPEITLFRGEGLGGPTIILPWHIGGIGNTMTAARAQVQFSFSPSVSGFQAFPAMHSDDGYAYGRFSPPTGTDTSITGRMRVTELGLTGASINQRRTDFPLNFVIMQEGGPTPLALADPADRTYTVGTALTAADDATGGGFPAATGGTPPYTYNLEIASGDSDAFDATDLTFTGGGLSTLPTITGTARNAGSRAFTWTYKVTDAAATPGVVMQEFKVTVVAATVMTPDLAFVTNTLATDNITLITGTTATQILPVATGGTSPYSYSLLSRDGSALATALGISFDGARRTLGGTAGTVGGYQVRYQVSDSNASSKSLDFTITVIAAVTGNKPSAPQRPNVRYDPDGPQNILTWLAPLTDGGSPITRYEITRSGGTGGRTTIMTGPNALTATDNVNIQFGITYTYLIFARNLVGLSDSISARVLTFEPMATGGGAMFSSVAMNGYAVNSFTSGSGNGVFSATLSVAAGVSSAIELVGPTCASGTTGDDCRLVIAAFDDSTLDTSSISWATYSKTAEPHSLVLNPTGSDVAGSPHTLSWRVGDSTNFITVNIAITVTGDAPGAVPSLIATQTIGSENSSVDLVWTPPGNTGSSAVTGYAITRKVTTAADSTFAAITGSPFGAAVRTATDSTGLAASTGYTYRIAAVNAVGAGGVTVTTVATAAAAVPTVSGGAIVFSGATVDGLTIVSYDGSTGSVFSATLSVAAGSDTTINLPEPTCDSGDASAGQCTAVLNGFASSQLNAPVPDWVTYTNNGALSAAAHTLRLQPTTSHVSSTPHTVTWRVGGSFDFFRVSIAVTVTGAVANTAPTAVIVGAASRTVDSGDQVMLDGSGSSDDTTATVALAYRWTLSGSGSLNRANTATAIYTAPTLSPGSNNVTATVSLIVTDNAATPLASAPDTVRITVTAPPAVVVPGSRNPPRNVMARVTTSAGASTTGTISLEWDAPSSGTPTGYDVQVQVTDYNPVAAGGAPVTGSFVAVTPAYSGTRTMYTHSNVDVYDEYTYRVRARYAGGNSVWASLGSTTALLVRGNTNSIPPFPAQPINVRAVISTPSDENGMGGAVTITWDPPVYKGIENNIHHYGVWVNDGAMPIVTPTGTSYVHRTTVTGALRYRICAVVGTNLMESRRGIDFFDGQLSAFTAAATVTLNQNNLGEIAGALNQSVLPEAGRAVADNVMGAVSRRLDTAGNVGGMFRFGGQRTFAEAMAVHGRALLEGRFDLNTVLGNTEFVLPLAGGLAGAKRSLTIWGGGDYRNLNGNNGSSLDWDGDLFSAYLGADVQLRDNLRGGIAVSRSESEFDYDLNSTVGDYALTMTGLHPYLGWSSASGRFTVHATAGYGWGDVAVTESGSDDRASSEAILRTVGVGGSGRLVTVGDTDLRIKGDVAQTAVEVDGNNTIPGITVEARRFRVTVEGSRVKAFGDGARLTQRLSIGLRHDAGASRTGTGAEFSGGLRYVLPSAGLTVEGHGRGLVAHGGDYEDWGFGGQILLQPENGDGFSMSIRPDYSIGGGVGGGGIGGAFGGGGVGGGSTLWNQGASALTNTNGAVGATPRTRVATNIGYVLPFHDGTGLLTPYGGLTFGATRTYRLGTRLTLPNTLTLNLEGSQTLNTLRPTHRLKLELGMDW